MTTKTIIYGLILALLPVAAQASRAGQVLFTMGDVRVSRSGDEIQLARGHEIRNGDTLLTGAGARTQIRMVDGGLLSLRPGTEFEISDYRYDPGPRIRQSADSGLSFFSLVKGGLRFITGLIGQRVPANFQITTRTAIIGIRGTTFDLACVDSCRDRVVAGVIEGRIVIANAAGELILENDEFGQATGWDARPSRLPGSPPELRDDLTPTTQDDERFAEVRDDDDSENVSADDDYATASNSPDNPPPDGREEAVTAAAESPLRGTLRDLAYGTAPFGAAGNGRSLGAVNDSEAVVTDAAGSLVAFDGQWPTADGELESVRYSIAGQTASNLDTGRDPGNQLHWGRWGSGQAQVQRSGGSTEALDLSQQSLHWIMPAVREGNPRLPSTGSLSFNLIGNTDPTDQAGNRGVLGVASLDADFSQQTVSSSLNLFIADEAWAASGIGQLGEAEQAHLFAGTYQDLSTDGVSGGAGQFAGFFTDQARAAGLNYVLSNGARQITGVAAFRSTSP